MVYETEVNTTNSPGELCDILPPNYFQAVTLIGLSCIALLENVATCVLITRKGIMDKHSIYVVIISLSFSDILLCLNMLANLGIFLYIANRSAKDMDPYLCTIVFFINFLAVLISTSQLLLISVMRTVSIFSIQTDNYFTRLFTKFKTILCVVIVWIFLTTGCGISMIIDKDVYGAAPVYCRFRSIVGLFGSTTLYILVMNVFNYSLTLALFAVTIYRLIRIYLRRRMVFTIQAAGSTYQPSSKRQSHVQTDSTGICTIGYRHSYSYQRENSRQAASSVTMCTDINEAPSCLTTCTDINDGPTTHTTCNSVTENRQRQLNKADDARQRPVKRHSKELIATVIVGILIATHSAAVIPWIIELALVRKDPERTSGLFRCGVFSLINALVDPFIFLFSLPSVRVKLQSRCPNVCIT